MRTEKEIEELLDHYELEYNKLLRWLHRNYPRVIKEYYDIEEENYVYG